MKEVRKAIKSFMIDNDYKASHYALITVKGLNIDNRYLTSGIIATRHTSMISEEYQYKLNTNTKIIFYKRPTPTLLRRRYSDKDLVNYINQECTIGTLDLNNYYCKVLGALPKDTLIAYKNSNNEIEVI